MELLNQLRDCQNGNKNQRNLLIQQYFPFIVKVTSQHLNRYIEVENNDELIIAMIAFDEAITKYNEDKGGFIAFAERLIKNRLIDYQRTGDKLNTLSYDDPDSTIGNYIADKENLEENVVEKNEIEAYENSLRKFGLTYEALIEASPKHTKTRKKAMTIGKSASNEPPIVDKLYDTKRLPITKIATTFKVTIKIIKRSKSLITSVIIAYVEKFETITEWIDRSLKDEEYVKR